MVRLRDVSPTFYSTGLRLSRLCGGDEAGRLPAAIQATLATRVAGILSRAHHSLSTDVSEYVGGLTDLEQALFWAGYAFVRDRLAWKKRLFGRIRRGDERPGEGAGEGGALRIGAESRPKRPRY